MRIGEAGGVVAVVVFGVVGIVARALVVAEFVCKGEVIDRLAVVGDDAEAESRLHGSEPRIVERRNPGDAAGAVGLCGDNQDHQVRAMAIAEAVDLVHVTCGVRAATVGEAKGGIEGQAIEVYSHIGVLGIAHLVLVNESQTKPNPGIGVCPVGVVDCELDEGVDVSRRPSRCRRIGDKDIDFVAGVSTDVRRCGVAARCRIRNLLMHQLVPVFQKLLLFFADELPPSLRMLA